MKFWAMMIFGFLGAGTQMVYGQISTPQSTPTLTLDQEKQRLEMEKLELENEKLKLEMEKLQLTATPVSGPSGQNLGQGKTENELEREANDYQAEMTEKAEKTAKTNKDNPDIVVVDLANAEIWHKGVRYGIHQLFDLAEDNHYEMVKKVDQIDPAGDSRYLYRFKNLSLLRYESKKRGIVEILAPANEGDFKMLSPEGISFDSGIGDVRNAFHNIYFIYDGEDHEDHRKVLKYVHKVSWDFSDRLNFEFDKDGRLLEIRFGVLDEH